MDDSLLIEQVAFFPFLYDKKEQRFKSKIARENAWKTIGEILEETPSACEHRWIVLRAKYTGLRRQLKSIPSGSGAVRETWPHFDSMGFLDPYLTTRKTSTNFKGKEAAKTSKTGKAEAWNTLRTILNDDAYCEEESQSSTIFDTEDISMEETENAMPSTSAQPIPSTSAQPIPPTSAQRIPLSSQFSPANIPRSTLPCKPKKRSAQEALCDQMGSCFEHFSKKISKTEESSDGDIDFVKGLAKDMQALTNIEKIIFKKKIYTTLAEVLEKRDA